MTTEEKIEIVKDAIRKLYSVDKELVDRDLCERCLVHRLAIHLGNNPHLEGYFVDCEFNKAFDIRGNIPKYLSSKRGNYVDIIIHKRSDPLGDNLLCFEVKKSSNGNKQQIEKDKKNLQMLTTDPYYYTLGFHINLTKNYETTKAHIYIEGRFIGELKMQD